VTLAGSGLTFVNTYDADVSASYRDEILTAEHFLQGHFSTVATLNVSFDQVANDPDFVADNTFGRVDVSYAQFVAALSARATTPDDQLAIAGLPASDPTGGLGFSLPAPYAGVLGLGPPSEEHVHLTDLAVNDTKTALGAIEHEITEGGFGRLGSLGVATTGWWPEDLFRFTAGGQRDFTGGTDGVAAFFGIDANHVTDLMFHNPLDSVGRNDGQDFGDWDGAFGDAFGASGPGLAGVVSNTDLRVLDILGWTPIPQPAVATGPDDFADSFADTTHPFGPLAANGSATGAIDFDGDRDWFKVQLQQGEVYTLSVTGQGGGGGTLADPSLSLFDNNGVFRAFEDDAVPGSDFDAKLVFDAARTGTYFIQVSAFDDAGAGSYRIDLQAATPTGAIGTAGDDTLAPIQAGPELDAGLGNDTVIGGVVTNDVLRGNEGDDLLAGGPGFDDINGNQGDDTEYGDDGDDWVVGGKDQDVLFGGNGVDLVLGNLGDDTIGGDNGDDILRGGQGDDSVAGGNGNDFVSGDRGNDTETGGPGADIFHGSQDAGIDRVLDFTVSEGDRVELDPGTTFTVRQEGADTVIDMGAIGGVANEMILVGVPMSSLTATTIFGA
jgi:Ca2+-binding RTX toxin-like protein